jgi:glycosyltransferase involved in cell wall biosynthesis
MRIAYLCLEAQQSRYHISGYAVHLNAMSDAFRRAGHEVEMLVLGEWLDHRQPPSGEDAPIGETLKQKVKRVVPRKGWESLKDLRISVYDAALYGRYREFLEGFRPDAIYEQVAFNAGSGMRLARELDLPRMAEVHAPMAEERARDGRESFLTGRAKRIEMEVVRSADAVRVVSSPLRQYLIENGVAAERIIVQPNGTDLERFHPGAGDLKKVRERLNLDGRFVFGFVGSFFRWHAIDVLIRAFAEARKACPDAALLIVGDGEDGPELRELGREVGVGADVMFTGNVPHDEMVDYYAAMDVCCMAGTNWYCSPLKLLEYGAMRKPVIAAELESVRDILSVEDSMLCPHGDVSAFAQAMISLRGDSAGRERLATRLHDKVATQFSWDRVAANILSRLEAVVAKRGGSA